MSYSTISSKAARFLAAVVVLSLGMVLLPAGRLSADLVIDGNPLRISLEDHERGSTRVHLLQGQNYVRQYYWVFANLLHLNGQLFGSEDLGMAPTTLFTPVSTVKPNNWTTVNTVTCGDNIEIVQTLQYVNGQNYFTKTWQISNNGQTTYEDVSWTHGGDTYFAGDDWSVGHWDPILGMVYLSNPDPNLTGIMGLYGGLDSPPDEYYEANYSSVWQAMANGQLPNTVRGDYHDAAYALLWRHQGSFAPGMQWNITAYEKWTEAGSVQVLAGGNQSVQPGDRADIPFTIRNYQSEGDVFHLVAVNSAGWPISLEVPPSQIPVVAGVSVMNGDDPGAEGEIYVPAAGQETVIVRVDVPEDAPPGAVSEVMLTAVSYYDQSVFNQDSMLLQIEPEPDDDDDGEDPDPDPDEGEMKDMTEFIRIVPLSWAVDRATGAMRGAFRFDYLKGKNLPELHTAFWIALPDSVNWFLYQQDGYTPTGVPYTDVTREVEFQLSHRYGRIRMLPGDSIVLEVLIYSRDRSIPPFANFYAFWADPPVAPPPAPTPAHPADLNADGRIDEFELLIAIDEWANGLLNDFVILEVIELWRD